jgi:hypothetical protein
MLSVCRYWHLSCVVMAVYPWTYFPFFVGVRIVGEATGVSRVWVSRMMVFALYTYDGAQDIGDDLRNMLRLRTYEFWLLGREKDGIWWSPWRSFHSAEFGGQPPGTSCLLKEASPSYLPVRGSRSWLCGDWCPFGQRSAIRDGCLGSAHGHLVHHYNTSHQSTHPRLWVSRRS